MSAAAPNRSRRRRTIAIAAAVLIGAAAALAFFVLRSVPVTFSDPADRYKYGSFGTEADSLPLAIWEALPDVCPDRLPGGWASIGLIYEPGREVPVGVSRRRVGGIERMGVNCAMCHVGAVRQRSEEGVDIVLGMPNHQLDFERYVQFILDCVADPRFNSSNVLMAMRKHGDVSAVEAAFYRYAVIPTVKRLTREKAQQFSWMAHTPRSGPGRLDTPNSLKRMLNVDITSDSVGTVDFPSVWNQEARGSHFRHWDANSPSLTERDHITAAIAGATSTSLDGDEVRWIERWLDALPPPAYPFPIDRARVARGEVVYQQNCAACHTQRALDVTSIALLATDRHRLDALSAELVARMNAFGSGSGTSAHYRKTDGYSNVLLDGIWARAPYLHNGSVPTLRDLLEPAARRPMIFYAGSPLYDPVRVGFVSTGKGPERGTFRYDTRVAGNGNGGHDYGTMLDEESKRNLLEYLKTL